MRCAASSGYWSSLPILECDSLVNRLPYSLGNKLKESAETSPLSVGMGHSIFEEFQAFDVNTRMKN